jgi:hypothetical protein
MTIGGERRATRGFAQMVRDATLTRRVVIAAGRLRRVVGVGLRLQVLGIGRQD